VNAETDFEEWMNLNSYYALLQVSIGTLRRWLRKVPDFQQDGIFKFVKIRGSCTKIVDVVSKYNITVELASCI
jgi:predicted site-specific integrase-resolvase